MPRVRVQGTCADPDGSRLLGDGSQVRYWVPFEVTVVDPDGVESEALGMQRVFNRVANVSARSQAQPNPPSQRLDRTLLVYDSGTAPYFRPIPGRTVGALLRPGTMVG
jgi:hypothetical protein